MMVELCNAKVKQEAVLTYEHILYLKLDFLHVGGASGENRIAATESAVLTS